jgi:polyisoprenoid-binding protein YceI
MKLFAPLIGATLLATSAIALAEPVSYAIDPTHTDVVSESRHFGTSTTRSRFAAKSGTVTIDTAAKTGKANITIDMTSITTGVPKLDDHLKGISFFDAAGYPEASFVSTAFTFDGDKVSQITGDLTMHGKTGPVTLKATNYNCYMSPAFKKQVCGGDFEATIQRSQWDVKFLIPLVSDETKLFVQIEAVKE